MATMTHGLVRTDRRGGGGGVFVRHGCRRRRGVLPVLGVLLLRGVRRTVPGALLGRRVRAVPDVRSSGSHTWWGTDWPAQW